MTTNPILKYINRELIILFDRNSEIFGTDEPFAVLLMSDTYNSWKKYDLSYTSADIVIKATVSYSDYSLFAGL